MVLEHQIYTIVFAPLFGALFAGLGCRKLPKNIIYSSTIVLLLLSTLLSIDLMVQYVRHSDTVVRNFNLYQWAFIDGVSLNVGFLIDPLTVIMLTVVTSISFLVHVYSIGYMEHDEGSRRFFSYISLFTFAMLMLVTANNFMQLFFGWEAVGLVSYLLIGFWFKRDSAIFANMKAFLVNRVGDLGFLLGIGGVLVCFNTLDYKELFETLSSTSTHNLMIPGIEVDVLALICICLFIGAMGKSAQVPLHVWLPDSMEGPTPISALIHAATMVTAGIFMVARLSPLFELSDTALNFVMFIGAITCFFMGILGVIQNDIKRIVAYSTLSQLGYMVTALGASAYSLGIFHLYTHAFFKALLFLGAGAVIVALHHQQNIMKMGNLKAYMPKTYFCMLMGTLSLVGFPFFSGFYSKDLIIEAVKFSNLPVSKFAYLCVISSVFVTSLYSFRLLFLVFHTEERMDIHDRDHLNEGHWSLWAPLLVLSIPSIFVGFFAVDKFLGDLLSASVHVLPQHGAMAEVENHFHGAFAMAKHGFTGLPFIMLVLGALCAWFFWVKMPHMPKVFQKKLSLLHKVLIHKYGFDLFNEKVIAPLTRGVGWLFFRIGDTFLIDGLIVKGIPKVIYRLGNIVRSIQTGLMYHYILVMVIGLIFLVFLCASQNPLGALINVK
jgi:NADH-quinone oxidoreductase subunit L